MASHPRLVALIVGVAPEWFPKLRRRMGFCGSCALIHSVTWDSAANTGARQAQIAAAGVKQFCAFVTPTMEVIDCWMDVMSVPIMHAWTVSLSWDNHGHLAVLQKCDSRVCPSCSWTVAMNHCYQAMPCDEETHCSLPNEDVFCQGCVVHEVTELENQQQHSHPLCLFGKQEKPQM